MFKYANNMDDDKNYDDDEDDMAEWNALGASLAKKSKKELDDMGVVMVPDFSKEVLDDYDRDNLVDDTSMEEQLYDILFKHDGYPEAWKSIRRDYIFGHNTNLESLYSQHNITDQQTKNGIASFFRWAEKLWASEK